MNKITTYLLLVVLSVNIFGAGTGELVHFLSHAFEGAEVHWHTHHHDAASAHHPEAGQVHHHTHSGVTAFLLESFSTFDQSGSAQCLLHLNWLMLSLTGLLSAVCYATPPDAFSGLHGAALTLPYQSIISPTPSPPPRLIAPPFFSYLYDNIAIATVLTGCFK